MFGNEFSEDQRPLTYIQGYPIHAATLIVVAYVVTLLATTVLMAAGQHGIELWLAFDSRLILGGGQVWRFLTYGLWNPPSIGFVIDMFLIAFFGRELERFFGRKTFLRFFAMLYLLQPVLYTVLGLFRPTTLVGETGAFAMFIGFATLYPNVPLFFNILAKWLAVIVVGIYSAMAMAGQNLIALITLWLAVGFAYAFVRYEQGRWAFPTFQFGRQSKFRVVSREEAEIAGETAADEVASDMDELLDKIAKSGMASLTSKERARLQKAREDLLRKEKR